MADMIYVSKSEAYSVISNFHLMDKRLSWNAKGLLSVLLVTVGKFQPSTLEKLVEVTASAGEQRTAEGLAELEACGYLLKEQLMGRMRYTVCERPLHVKKPVFKAAEIMDPEDMPGNMTDKKMDEEEEQKLRKRLALGEMEKRYSKDFVDRVFCELCRRDADFRLLLTAKAFEKICAAISEDRMKYGKCGSGIDAAIKMAFDAIVNGCDREKGIDKERVNMLY